MSGTTMLDKASATGAGASFHLPIDGKTTFHAKGATTASTGAASVVVEVSNDGSNWVTAGTISLTLTTSESSDGFAFDGKWDLARGNVSSISGTGAYVSLFGKDLIGV